MVLFTNYNRNKLKKVTMKVAIVKNVKIVLLVIVMLLLIGMTIKKDGMKDMNGDSLMVKIV